MKKILSFLVSNDPTRTWEVGKEYDVIAETDSAYKVKGLFFPKWFPKKGLGIRFEIILDHRIIQGLVGSVEYYMRLNNHHHEGYCAQCENIARAKKYLESL